jgi:outer membrane protein OmpA-like peptidoglycan-associated protein
VRDWDQIASEPPLDVSGLLKKTTDLMDTTQHVMKNLDTVAGDLSTVASRVARGDGTMGALLNDRTLYNQLNGTATQARETMTQARETMTQAKAGVTAFQENMEALKGNILFRGYFKDRGYRDAADLTRWELPELPTGVPAKTFTLTAADLFEKAGSAKLKDGKRLEAPGTYLEKNPFRLAVIQAFAGLKGTHEDNLALTRAQAMVVRAYLAVTFELDDAKVKTKAMGETASAPGEDGRIVIAVY